MVPFVGPSYTLRTRKFDVQRSVNLYPAISESGSSKAPAILNSIPGLTLFCNVGAEIRGLHTTADGRCFAVGGGALYELTSGGVATNRGNLSSSTGAVDIAENTNQLIVVDGTYGHVLTLATNAFSSISSPAFYGSQRVAVLDGYAIFIRPGTGQFYISGIDDAASFDALDFATAEGSSDRLVSVVSDHRELWLFGTHTTEVWFNSGATDFPFERNQGAFLEVGCIGAHSARKLDNSVFWLGQDRNGAGIVYRADGFSPRRVSTLAVEQALQQSTDLTQARAFAYQQEGHSFYVLNAPGLSTSWAYDVATDSWHERAELVDGDYEPHRAVCHTFAFGAHLVGAEDGKIYRFDTAAHTNAGDELVRDRVSPHNSLPTLQRVFFDRFELDTTPGQALSGAPLVSMRYSNDGGVTWGSWTTRELGSIGEYNQRLRWLRCGSARDRVWQVRCTDNAPFSIIGAHVAERAGAS